MLRLHVVEASKHLIPLRLFYVFYESRIITVTVNDYVGAVDKKLQFCKRVNRSFRLKR